LPGDRSVAVLGCGGYNPPRSDHVIRKPQLEANAPRADVTGVAAIALRVTACLGSGAAASS